MLICPKCSKMFGEDFRICRDCGAILEPVVEVPAEELSPEVLTNPVAEFDFVDDPVSETERESEGDQSPWRCPACKEAIEANFDVCWNCGTNRQGMPDPGFVSERTEPEPWGPDPVRFDRAVPTLALPSQTHVPESKCCVRCGSTHVIPNAIIGDQAPGPGGILNALVIGNPDAWIFKDVEYSELKADICGQCGHVELKATNPGVLYEHYRRSQSNPNAD